MKHYLVVGLLGLLLVACGGNSKSKGDETKTKVQSEVYVASPSVVYVYYFHGKQRCRTCVAVETQAKKTIEESYSGDKSVQFIAIDTGDKKFEKLVEKYEVSWNALIVSKGENAVNITEQAFASAVNNPEVLDNLIKEEVGKRLN